jgi:NTE family protein
LQNQKNIRIITFSVKEEDDVSKRHRDSRNVENVLVLHGGGSLRSFECGVFKGLVERTVRIDIVAGTSIGAVNAAIIA